LVFAEVAQIVVLDRHINKYASAQVAVLLVKITVAAAEPEATAANEPINAVAMTPLSAFVFMRILSCLKKKTDSFVVG